MNTTDTLRYFAAYHAAPAAENFKPMSAAELRVLCDSYRAPIDPAWTEAAALTYLTDQSATDIAHDMAADGVQQILMAGDEDGLYFATAAPVWRIYSPCGARKWIVAATADDARTEVEAWIADGVWNGEEAFVEPFTGVDSYGDAMTDHWKRESVTVRGRTCTMIFDADHRS